MKTYKEHYKECQKKYKSNSDHNIYSVTLQKNCIEVDKNMLSAIHHDVRNHLLKNHDTTQTKWGTYVNDFSSISGLEEVCCNVVSNLEKKYFNSFVKIENLHILQNKINSPLESSWIWHYDDCPQEFLKFAVYLSEVNDNSGPMSYVKGAGDSIPVIQTFRSHPGSVKGYPTPVFPKSRVPKYFVDNIVSNGGSIETLTGEIGTNFLFTPNIIHKGNNPCSKSIKAGYAKPRIAIFMFIRPSIKKIKNYTLAAKPKKANVNVKKYNLD